MGIKPSEHFKGLQEQAPKIGDDPGGGGHENAVPAGPRNGAKSTQKNTRRSYENTQPTASGIPQDRLMAWDDAANDALATITAVRGALGSIAASNPDEFLAFYVDTVMCLIVALRSAEARLTVLQSQVFEAALGSAQSRLSAPKHQAVETALGKPQGDRS